MEQYFKRGICPACKTGQNITVNPEPSRDFNTILGDVRGDYIVAEHPSENGDPCAGSGKIPFSIM